MVCSHILETPLTVMRRSLSITERPLTIGLDGGCLSKMGGEGNSPNQPNPFPKESSGPPSLPLQYSLMALMGTGSGFVRDEMICILIGFVTI